MHRKSNAPLWPGRPIPLEGETFSSWFSRVAHTNFLNPSDLYAAINPGARLYSLDFERWSDPTVLMRMSEGTDVEKTDLSSLLPAEYQGRVFVT